MKVIDAHTGRELKEGDVVPLPGIGSRPDHIIAKGWYRIIKIEPGLMKARVFLESSEPRLHRMWQPLIVRWTHPGFFLQHVAFVPS
jgi:hypothetical protein